MLISIHIFPRGVHLLHKFAAILRNQHPPAQPSRDMLVILGFEFPPLGVLRADNPIAEFRTALHRRAFPGKDEGSEAVHRVRSQLCPFVAAGLSTIITRSKTTGRPISALSTQSCLHSIEME